MAEPWDIPSPVTLDHDVRTTFEGMGRVINAWERVEFELSRLYSTFVGDHDGKALQTYGEPRVFSERLSDLRKAGEQYFIQRCDQRIEGKCRAVLLTSERFSTRRNQVAHGIVQSVSTVTHFASQFNQPHGLTGWALIPPYYMVRSHVGELPTYIYTSREMFLLSEHLMDFESQVRAFRTSLCAAP